MDREKLSAAVEAHGKWLRGENGGEQAYLSGADLSGVDLEDAIFHTEWKITRRQK